MAKRFKFRICRVFQSCRSKDPSTLPSNPVPCFVPEPHRSSLRRHVSHAFESVGCGFSSSRPTLSDADDHRNGPHHDFHWEQQDKWHVVAKVCAAPDNNTTPRRKIYSSSVSAASDDEDNDDVLPLPPPPNAMKKKGRAKKKKKTTPRFRMSTSSADSCGLFSSDGHDVIDEEETETLVSSSRSFSTDSSSVELDSHLELESICETPGRHQGVKKMKSKSKKKKKKKKSKKKKKDGRVSFSSSSSPARVSMLLRLVPCSVEGKVRESFAVVKRSEDPYEDFRRSMMEMIMEKQIFEDTDLEQLLHCFLSLNSNEHHGIIVQVFAEIWQSLFTSASTTRRDL
ncbi:hypothetical protein QN277_027777 [Acacia crassicarpa]|uniref:Transcription repressor n=1 Tax=Acacia crassicarpa TaxID=499986 RepID=A0AAE1MCH8_9FABA|nr:hypothetical protein QN277_027777 [Acacia crassicarpa]